MTDKRPIPLNPVSRANTDAIKFNYFLLISLQVEASTVFIAVLHVVYSIHSHFVHVQYSETKSRQCYYMVHETINSSFSFDVIAIISISYSIQSSKVF